MVYIRVNTGYNMPMTDDATKSKIVIAWAAAYADWENGRGLSPSAGDLAGLAQEVAEVTWDSEKIWELLCDGLELSEVVERMCAR